MTPLQALLLWLARPYCIHLCPSPPSLLLFLLAHCTLAKLPQTSQALSHFLAFAHAVPLAWKTASRPLQGCLFTSFPALPSVTSYKGLSLALLVLNKYSPSLPAYLLKSLCIESGTVTKAEMGISLIYFLQSILEAERKITTTTIAADLHLALNQC